MHSDSMLLGGWGPRGGAVVEGRRAGGNRRRDQGGSEDEMLLLGGTGPRGGVVAESRRAGGGRRRDQGGSEDEMLLLGGTDRRGNGSLADRFDREAKDAMRSDTARAASHSAVEDDSDDGASVVATPTGRKPEKDSSTSPTSGEKRADPGQRGHPIGGPPTKKPRKEEEHAVSVTKDDKRRPVRTPSPPATRRRTTKDVPPKPDKKDNDADGAHPSNLPTVDPGKVRDLDEVEVDEDSSHSWNLSQLDKVWEADKQNYDKNSIFGMRIPKAVPATQFTQNSVAGMDTMNLPVHHLLYKARKSYDFRLIANGRFCSLICVRSLNELYFLKSLLRVLRDRNFNVDVKELLAAIARDKNIPEPRVNVKRKEVMELLVQDYMLPKLQELVSGGRMDPQVSNLSKMVADLQRQLAIARGADAAAAATAREEPAAAMDHVEKFRRPEKMAKTLQGKFGDNPNSRTVNAMVKGMQLSMDQQKAMAGFLVELKHLTSPNKGAAGETVISVAEAQATAKEVRKIATDWGLPTRFLGAASSSVPNTVLDLLAMCTTLAQSETPS